MLKKLNEFIKSNELFDSDHKLLVATSGGIDSVVLCHLLIEAEYNISIAHCNFNLRGEESNKDENFVKELASNFKVAFYAKSFNTTAFASKNKISTQLAARQLRYDWFSDLCANNGVDFILTAHHASDQSETMLYNLTRGSGISGIRGILKKNQNIIRPLLFTTKEKIIQYAQQNQLNWREDESNQEDKYSRNLIRNKVIPELKKINSSFDKTMTRNADRYQMIEAFIAEEAQKIKSEHLIESTDECILNLDWLTDKNRVLLYHILSEYDFNHFQSENIFDSTEHSGSFFYSKKHKLTIDRNRLYISKKEENEELNIVLHEDDKSIIIEQHQFTFSLKKKTEVSISNNKNIAYLDSEKIDYPIMIRNWCNGDRFIPLGMKSEKKLSDFMIDEKIPVNLKKRLPIFTSNDKIFWIAGQRIDHRFRITDSTNDVLIINMEPQNV